MRTQAVSTGYGLIHHTQVTQGRWLRSDDADDMSPSLVVSQGFLDALGVGSLSGPLTVASYEPTRTTYTIVGVLKPEDLSYCTTTDAEGNTVPCPQTLSAFVLNSSYEQQLPSHAARPAPSLEIWTGAAGVSEIKQRAKDNLDAQFGQGSTQVTDNLQSANANLSTGAFTSVVSGAGVFVMVLGALGLVNISLVTVRQRIHEIGVRRSFGATSRRIFFSIMLESVVATVVAGIVGVGIAVVALRVVPLSAILDIPVPDNPGSEPWRGSSPRSWRCGSARSTRSASSRMTLPLVWACRSGSRTGAGKTRGGRVASSTSGSGEAPPRTTATLRRPGGAGPGSAVKAAGVW